MPSKSERNTDVSKAKDEGKYPGADPTAPGGMSQQRLADELMTKHGWQSDEVAQFRKGKDWNPKSWVAMIEAVIDERRGREREAEAEVADMRAAHAEAEAAAEAERAANSLLVVDSETLDYTFTGHAGAGPSAAERWMHCTASLGASRAFLETLTPNQQKQYAIANLAARQGTVAHAAAEVEANVVLGNLSQSEADLTLMELSIMPDESGEAYDEEMGEYITEYVDLIRQYDTDGRTVLIEQRVEATVELAGMHEGEVYTIKGSADCIVLPDAVSPELVVADLKYGNGINVDVDENPQIRIYALGALDLLTNEGGELITDVEKVVYHIVQPRLGGIKTWSESLDDLLDWRDDVLSGALTAALYGKEAGATFAPSEDACQWCPARGGCAALAEKRVADAADLFDTIVEAEFADGPGAFPETATLTDTRLGDLLNQVRGLTKIADDLKAEAQRRLYRGETVPGWQLVNYTPPRTWVEGAGEALDADPDVWVRKMLSPTQALAVAKAKGGKKDYTKMIQSPDKRPVIAPVGDRRKTWEGKPPEAMFPEMGDE